MPHLARQLLIAWADLNNMRQHHRPKIDWYSMIKVNAAFLVSIVAIDIVYYSEYLSESLRTAIEARFQAHYDFEATHNTGSWVLAKFGGLGSWEVYRGRRANAERIARAYDARLKKHFQTT